MTTPITLDLSGSVRIVDLDSQVVHYVATRMVGDVEVTDAKVTISGLAQATLRELAKRSGDPMPCSVVFGGPR